VGPSSVDFAGEDGDNLNDIEAKLLHGFFGFDLIKDHDFNSKVLAPMENDLAPAPRPAICAREDQFLDLGCDD
jgi:hypothetical protein